MQNQPVEWAAFELFEQHVGQQIREQRVAAKMSQAELASEVRALGYNVQQSTVAKIELGSRPIRVAELYIFAEALRVPWIRFMLDYAARVDDLPYQELRERGRELRHQQVQIEDEMLSDLRTHSRAYARTQVEIEAIEEQVRKLADGEA
ncbi:helix-turn-helix domain-containing protein [Clavibacter zhangzhiyongii]|uniref:helix-turn-helix domain-containing protein n=1 Tax=Clavibacter zhangzhiyongii TaxID=2768071 RepID=UPI0039E0DED1